MKDLSSIVENLIANSENDQTNSFLAYLLLSQVGEYIDDIDEIGPVINITLQNCSHLNPKVRYACFHCIGQLSEDLGIKFIQNFGATVITFLIVGLEDECIRVRAHAFSALANFIKACLGNGKITRNQEKEIYKNIIFQF